jgi:hypothetical protein
MLPGSHAPELRQALLPLYGGHSRAQSRDDLAIEPGLLAAWEQTVPISDLRPDGAEASSVTFSAAREEADY